MYSRSIFKRLVFVLAISACATVSAQNYDLIDWSGSSPPPQDIIFDASKGPGDYLWLATINGLYYFNGQSYFKFDFGEEGQLNTEYFLDIERDQSGNLWALTREFLIRIDDKQNFTKFATPGGRQSNRMPGQLVIDGKYNLWFTASNKIYRIINGSFSEVFAAATEDIIQLSPAFEAGCWISSRSRASKLGLSGSVEETVFYVDQPGDLEISAIRELRLGELAVAGFEFLQFYSKDGLSRSVELEGFGRIDDIALLEDEIHLVGEKGLAKLIDGKLVNYSTINASLSPKRLQFIHKEGNDKYWLSGWRSGLYQLKKSLIRTQKFSPKDLISMIEIDSENFIFATFFGLKIVTNGASVLWEHQPKNIQQQIRGIAYSPTINEILVAPSKGLFAIENTIAAEFKEIDFYHDKTINEVALFQGTEYLIATSKGFFIFNSKTQHSIEVRPRNDASPRQVHFMFPISNTKWVVLFDSGFAYFQSGTIGERYAKTYIDKSGDNQPLSFRFGASDAERNTFWLISDQPERQISYWKNGIRTTIELAKDPSVPNDTFYTLLIDSYNNLWVSHEYGLFRVKLPNKLSYSFISPLPVEVVDINPLGADECNTGSPSEHGSMIYFPCKNGMIEIDPANFRDSLPSPSTHLIKASHAGQTINIEKLQNSAPSFDTETRAFLFSYSALNFASNEKISFRARILNFDERWQQLPDNTLAISHLPSGNYRLEVQSRSGLSPWSTSHITPLQISLRFYETTWFLILILLALILSILFLIRIRTQWLISNQAQLEQLISEKTASLEVANQKLKLLHNTDQRDNYTLQVAVAGKTQALEEELEVRIKLEKELFAAHRMELLGQLSSGVSHDFNNMLSVILLSTESIQENLDELELPSSSNPYEKIHKRIVTIKNAIQQSKGVIGQLKGFNKQNQQSGLVNLNSEVTDAFNLAATTIDKNINVITEITKTKVESYINSAGLLQILLNLVVNARDACSKGATISLSLREAPSQSDLRCLTCGAIIPSNFHEIEVFDTGRGISNDNLIKMFNAFFTTKESSGGSGIGLRVVTNNVHDAKGHVFVESALGCWTKVRIFLPPAEDLHNLQGNRHLATSTPKTKKRRVLVVEDQFPVAEVLLELIDAHGFVGEHVETAEAALELLKHTPNYSLVITDHFLGGMTGKELLQRLRQAYPNLPLALMTAYQQITLPVDELNTLEVLRKPFTMADVGGLLKQIN